MEASGPPARQRNGAAGCSVERARGRVWSSLGTTVTLEQNMVETMMMVWQSWTLGLPPLLEIGIFLEGDFAGVRGGRGQRNRVHRAHPKSGPSWGPYPFCQGLEGYLSLSKF